MSKSSIKRPIGGRARKKKNENRKLDQERKSSVSRERWRNGTL